MAERVAGGLGRNDGSAALNQEMAVQGQSRPSISGRWGVVTVNTLSSICWNRFFPPLRQAHTIHLGLDSPPKAFEGETAWYGPKRANTSTDTQELERKSKRRSGRGESGEDGRRLNPCSRQDERSPLR